MSATQGKMPQGNMRFEVWMKEVAARMETVLDGVLPAAARPPTRLHEAMRYAVLGGGKRVRPLLAIGGGEVTGAEMWRCELAGAAVELVHAYSLIHDDLPCMDDDVLRRGKPTVHVQFDEATAMLAGDALQPLAFQILAENKLADDPAIQLEMVRMLGLASGSCGMAGGQAIDLASVGQQLTETELENMHIHKTGALIRASVMLGAHCGAPLSAADTQHLEHYAKAVGLLFQVVDDILDATASTATLGKTANKDADHDKPTYVSILGLPGAKRRVNDLLQEANDALSGFSTRATRLRELAQFIVSRSF
jgi:farnesyl diphosphate synthase